MANRAASEAIWSDLPGETPTSSLGRLSFPVCTDPTGRLDVMRLSGLPLPDQALLLILMQLSLQGLAGWQTAGAVVRICGQFSADDVRSYAVSAFERYRAWNGRTLAGEFPFLYVSAHPVRVFGLNEAADLTVMSAVGVSALSGHRECLGYEIGDGSPAAWTHFFETLRGRGFDSPDLVVSTFLPNMRAAAEKFYPNARFQRCIEELSSSVLRRAPSACRREMRSRLRTLFSLSTAEAAEESARAFAEAFREAAPNSVSLLLGGLASCSTVFQFPRSLRPRLGSCLSSFRKLNETLTRREKILTVYPDREAVLLLVGSVYYSFSSLWFSGSRPFLPMAVYRQWKETGTDVSRLSYSRKPPLYS